MPVFRISYGMRSTHVAHACDVYVIHVDREEKKSALLICELNKSIWIVVGVHERTIVRERDPIQRYAIAGVDVNCPYATKNLYDFEVWILIFGKSNAQLIDFIQRI